MGVLRTLLVVAAAVLALPAAAAAPARKVVVPPGFRVETFAAGLEQPTAMAWGPDRRLYVTQDGGTLVAVRRGSRRPGVVARGLHVPLGLVWQGRTLFVSEQGRVERFLLVGRRLRGRRVLVRGLPFGRHQQDNWLARRYSPEDRPRRLVRQLGHSGA